MHPHAHIHMHEHMGACAHRCTHVHMHTHTGVHAHTQTHAHRSTWTHTHTNTHTGADAHVEIIYTKRKCPRRFPKLLDKIRVGMQITCLIFKKFTVPSMIGKWHYERTQTGGNRLCLQWVLCSKHLGGRLDRLVILCRAYSRHKVKKKYFIFPRVNFL